MSLIPNDVSRCNNHLCSSRYNCKRFLQYMKDDTINGDRVPINRFSEVNCQNQLP